MHSAIWIAVFTCITIGVKAPDAPLHSQTHRERYPEKAPNTAVCDAENSLEPHQEMLCDSLFDLMEQKHHIEGVLVTLPEGYTTTEDFDDYCLDLAKFWAIGKQGKGMLIGISKHHRKMRIHNTEQLSRVLSDQQTKYVIDQYFIPYFKKEDYPTGIIQGIMALEDAINRR